MVFNATFNNISVMIVAVNFIGGGNRSIPFSRLFSFSIAEKSFTGVLKKQELSIPPVFTSDVLVGFLLFILFCVVVLLLFVYVLCLVTGVACVSGLSILDCYSRFV